LLLQLKAFDPQNTLAQQIVSGTFEAGAGESAEGSGASAEPAD